MKWLRLFKQRKSDPPTPEPNLPLPPIAPEQLAEWESVVQTVYRNTLGQTDHRWTRLRFQATKVLEEVAHAKTTAARRAGLAGAAGAGTPTRSQTAE